MKVVLLAGDFGSRISEESQFCFQYFVHITKCFQDNNEEDANGIF